MTTVVVTMDSATKTAFTVPANRIAKIKTIQVLNGSASDVIITIQDAFIPSPTINNSSPSEVTIDKKVIKVLAGDDVSLDNQDIEILGACLVTSTVKDANIKVTISFELTY